MIHIISSFLIFFGFLIVILGIVIWVKQNTMLISRSANVKEENVKSFTKITGISTMGIGLSLAIMGIFWAFRLMLIGILLFLICLALSFYLYVVAQKRYNNR